MFILFNSLGSYYFLTLLTVALIVLLIEYYRLFNLECLHKNFFINLIIILINFLFIYNGFNLIPIILSIFGIFLGIFFNRYKWLVPVSTYFYLAIPFYILLYLNKYHLNGKIIILWLFCIIWISDSSAYIFGNLIKGKKFSPNISPNKTWSGFIFSLIFSMISSAIFSYYFYIINIYLSMLIGLIIGFFTAIGDLYESYLKRVNKKKDTSKLIPGHGGLLDRLDGSLFAIVIMFFFILLWD